MRSRHAILAALCLCAVGCTETDDDSSAGDDDTTADDDTAGDDDTVADDDTAGDDDTAAGPTEARAMWVTRWDYASAADVATIFDDAEAGGFNVVFFQVRGTFDAYYQSTLEPWAAGLSGTLGQYPGWDPLATALEEGHSRDVQVHAWLNTFPVWTGTTPPTDSTPRHMYLEHPEWIVADSTGTPMALNSSYTFVSPGNPDVRAHIAAVAGDLVSGYDVDGVHLDYIRYPGSDYSHDAASLADYAAHGGGMDYGDWQREQITATAAGVQQAVDAVRPGISITAAVWGIYEDLWQWWSSQGNIDYYQDSLAMANEGAVDAIVPMIYWDLTEPPGGYTDFRTLVEFFAAEVAGESLWAGMWGDYDDFGEIADEIEVAREAGATGVSVFAYTYVVDHDYWDEFATGPFADPVNPPRR